MSSIYPNAIDGFAQLPLAVDTVTPIDAISVNRLRDAIVKIETELGIKPSGNFVDVRARLDALELGVDISEIQAKIDQLLAITTVSSDTNIDETFGTVLVDASGGNVTIFLPAAATDTKKYNIKKIDPTDNLVIIQPQVSETLDGAAFFEINFQYDSYTVINDGSNWFNI